MLSDKLDAYDVILSKQKYLAGNASLSSYLDSLSLSLIEAVQQECTLADLFHLPYGTMITSIGINFLVDEQKRPHVARCVIVFLSN